MLITSLVSAPLAAQDAQNNQDNTPPSVTSVTRQMPATSPTNARSLTWLVAFSEDVQNVDVADFNVTGAGNVDLAVAAVQGSQSQYNVTASGGNLDGDNLDGAVTLQLEADQDITDTSAANNPLDDNAFGNIPDAANLTYRVDKVAPTLEITVPDDPVAFFTATFTFSEPVQGFSQDDIQSENILFVSNFSPQGGPVWTAEFDVDVVDGPFVVRVPANAVTDAAGNANAVAEAQGIADVTEPTVSLIGLPDGNVVNSLDEFRFIVRFSEPVRDFDANRLVLTNAALTFGPAAVAAENGRAQDWTVGITPDGRGAISIDSQPDLAVDVAGNGSQSLPAIQRVAYNRPNDVSAPRVTRVIRAWPRTSPTNANSLNWHLSFDEGVQNVDAADFRLVGSTANISNVAPVAGDPALWNVSATGGDLVTGLDGAVTLQLAGAVTLQLAGDQNIQDAAGNRLANDALSSLTGMNQTNLSYEVDKIRPTVRGITAPDTVGAGAFEITVRFSEAVGGFLADRLALTNAAVTANTAPAAQAPVMDGRAENWTVSITPDANLASGSNITINIPVGVARDAVGNRNEALNAPTQVAYNDTAPTVTRVARQMPATSPTNADTLTWRLTFSKNVRDVDAADFSVMGAGGAAISNVAAVGGDQAIWDVTASGGNLDNADFNGNVTLQLAGGQDISDAAGNVLTGGFPADATPRTYAVDKTAPTVRLSGLRNNNTVATLDEFRFTVEFTDRVAEGEFVAGDLNIGNGAVTLAPDGEDTVGGRASSFTVGITPSEDLAPDQNITINIDADVVQNAAGDGNEALAPAVSVRYNPADRDAPTIASVTRQAPATSPTNADELTWRIEFSEAVRLADVTPADFRVVGVGGADPGQVMLAVAPVPDEPLQYNVTASGGNLAGLNGAVTLELAAGAIIRDTANNPLNGGFPEGDANVAARTYTVDNTAPTVSNVARQMPNTSPTNANTLTWRVRFDGDVKDVDAADFSVMGAGGAVISNVAADDNDNSLWDVTASGGNLDNADFNGAVTLQLAGGQDITDEAGNELDGNTLNNLNEENRENLTYRVDKEPPTVSLPNLQATVGAVAFNLAVQFSEPVDGFAADDLVLTNAAVTMGEVPEPADPNDPAPTRNWTVSITPDGMGDISINIPAGAAQDAVDNDSAALAAAEQVAYDGNLPTLQITGVPQAAKEPFTATFTFDKAVLGFEANDIIGTNVAGAGVSAFTETTPGEVWTALITPQADGDFTVEVAAGAATDNLGNPNAQAQAPGTYDTVAPTVSISNPPVTVGAGEFELTVEFSEAVGNFQLDDAAITDGTVSTDPEPADPAAVVAGRASNWKVGITPTDGLASPGTITINIPAAAAQDAAGNNSAALDAVQDIAYDATRPTVNLAGVPANTDNLAAFDITVTFGVAVSGFEAADLALTNAAVTAGPTAQNADAAGRATEWAVTLTPTAGLASGSNIEIAIPENAAQSATGSQSLALDRPELVAYNPPAAPPPPPGAVPPRGAPGVVQGGAGAPPAAPPAPPGEVTLRIQSSDAGTVTFESSTAALAGSVNVSAAAAGSFGPISLPAGDYEVNYRLPAGFAVLEASCEAEGSQIDVAEGNIALNVSAGQSLECSLSLQNNQMAATAQVETLLDDRAQLVQSQRPNPSRRLGRLQGRSSATTLSLGGRQAAAAGTLPFDLLLDQERLQLGYSRMATPADEVLAALPALDLWFEVTLGKYRAGQGKGRYGIVHAGVDTLLSDDWLVGVGISGDRLTQSRSSEASGYRSTGWLLGPYVTGRLYQNLYVDMQLSGGMASNTLSPTWGGTSEFDSSRFYGALSLFGDFNLGKLAITPKVSGSWYREKSKSYTDSYGIAIPSAVMRNGALETGLRMSHTQDDGRSSQYLEIDGIWNLDGSSAQDQRLRIGLGGTLAAPWLGGSLEGGVRFDGIGADNWQDTAVHLGYRSRPGLLFGGSLETGLDMTGIAAQALGLRIGFTRPERIFGGAFSSDLSLAPQGSAESFRLQLNYEVRF